MQASHHATACVVVVALVFALLVLALSLTLMLWGWVNERVECLISSYCRAFRWLHWLAR